MSAPNYMRQTDFYDPERNTSGVTIVGCGGIGSFSAFALAKLGVPSITLIDHDEVEEHNLPNQMFTTTDVGMPKAEALRELIAEHAPDCDVVPLVEKFEEVYAEGNVRPSGLVIAGLDSMEARKGLWDLLPSGGQVPLYIDGRLGGQTVVLYAVRPFERADARYYAESLYTDEEAEDDPCTGRALIDVGFVIASMITRAVRREFTGQPVERVIAHNQASFNSDLGLRPDESAVEVM